MADETRPVVGRAWHPISQRPIVGAPVIFTLSGSFTPATQYLATSVTVYTESDGTFTAALWPNEEGDQASTWTCQLPDGTDPFSFSFAYDDGSEVELSALRAAGGDASDPQNESILTNLRALATTTAATAAATALTAPLADVAAAAAAATTAAADAEAAITVVVNAQTGTAYTLALSDVDRLITLSNAAAITLTIPSHSSVAWPVGRAVSLQQIGAGQVTVAAGVGVTLYTTGTKLRTQWSAATLIQTAQDVWTLIGDVTA